MNDNDAGKGRRQDDETLVLEDEDLDALAFAFEGTEEKTSPELIRRDARRVARDALPDAHPIAILCTSDVPRRRSILAMLMSNGWSAHEVSSVEDLCEMARQVGPQLVIADGLMQRADGLSVAESLKSERADSPTRTLALLHATRGYDIPRALADGFDDFVGESASELEVLSRANAGLRASRALVASHKQRGDAATLLELSRTLATSVDMQPVLHNVSRLVSRVVGLDRCSIVLLDPDDDEAIIVAASEDRSVRELRIKVSNYPEIQRCVQTAATLLISNTIADPILDSVRAAVVGERGVRAMALFPIIFEERVTGVLFLRSEKASRRLNPDDVQFGETAAASCAVAIRNARLFDQFKDQSERINSMRVVAERQMEALKKYEDFFEYAADGMAIIDGDGRIRYVNGEGRRLLARNRDELRAARFPDLLVNESNQRWGEVVDQVRHGRFKRSFDIFVARGDGGERIFSLSAGAVGLDTGLIILSFRDVTETREMEGELRTTKDFLENLIDNSVDAIVAADMNGNIMLFNKGAERIFEFRAEDVIGGMHVSQLYRSGIASDVMFKLRDERWGGRGRLEAQRCDIVTASREVVPVSMTASIIYEDGDEVATVGVYTDQRDRLAIERRLSEAQDQLIRSEKTRVAAELAGMAAHELNQPLTSVLGYAEMLRNRVPETDLSLRRPIDTIFKQAERMAEIVRKIGRVTKYETKRYGPNTDMIDLARAASPEAETSVFPTYVPRATIAPVTAPPIAIEELVTSPPMPAGLGRVEPAIEPTLPPSSLRPRVPLSPAAQGAAFMANLASVPARAASSSVDPRAAVLRLDTIDEEPVNRRSTTPPSAAEPRRKVSTLDLHPARDGHDENVGSAPELDVDDEGHGLRPQEKEEPTSVGVRIHDMQHRPRAKTDE